MVKDVKRTRATDLGAFGIPPVCKYLLSPVVLACAQKADIGVSRSTPPHQWLLPLVANSRLC